MIAQFAAFTGDFNSMHLDEEIARKSRFRARVAHGMLSFSFLSCIQQDFPESKVRFKSLEARFLKPVFPGDRLSLHFDYPEPEADTRKFTAVWSAMPGGDVRIKASGTFALTAPAKQAIPGHDAPKLFLKDQPEEAALTLSDLEGREATLDFKLDSASLSTFSHILSDQAEPFARSTPLCPNLAATLLLSTLVGMRLPGRFATFTSFKIVFDPNIEADIPYRLHGAVKKVLPASESLELSIAIHSETGVAFAGGNVKSLISPPPRTMPGCADILANYTHLGLRDKVVLITGASRGIGETTGKLFAMHGAKVVVHYFKGKKDAEAIVKDIRDNGGKAISLACDIRNETDVASLVAAVLENFGSIDVLVNNAVREFQPKNLLDLEWSDYLGELEVSLKGMHNCCREIIPHFKKQKSGKIINLSSLVVDHPVTGQNQYITAKSAVVGYTRSLATELLKHNIQVNLVAPNMAETDLLSSIPAEFVKRIGQERAYGRNLSPMEVALSILYLASPWTDGITGQKIVLNLGEPPFA